MGKKRIGGYIIISVLDIEKPDTYREVILSLGQNKVLPQKFSKEIANMISFRNILVHDYMRVDEKNNNRYITQPFR